MSVLQVVSKSANIYPKDPEFPTDGVEDMTRLSYMHEPGVLQNLQIRYTINEIYVRSHSCFSEDVLCFAVATIVIKP